MFALCTKALYAIHLHLYSNFKWYAMYNCINFIAPHRPIDSPKHVL